MYSYNTSAFDTASSVSEGVLVGLGLVAIFIIIFALAIGIFMIVCQWKIFKKAGKNGWEAIIPFYSTWVEVEIAGLNWWWFLIVIGPTLISVLGIPVLSPLASLAALLGTIAVDYNICKKMHQETGFLILLILVPIVARPMMAFSDKYQFDNDVDVNPNAFFGGNTTTTTNQTTTTSQKAETKTSTTASKNTKFCTNCGTKVDKDVKFCTNCGTKLN